LVSGWLWLIAFAAVGRARTVVDIPPGSALESAYSVLGLSAVIPVGQRGQGRFLGAERA